MSTPIPPPLRAAAGLAAAAIDSARKVPQQLVGLPVLAISTALQASLKAQQAYAGLVARGDEVLGQLRGQQDDPPWARFDEDEPSARPRSAFDAVSDADVEDLAAEAELAARTGLAGEYGLVAETETELVVEAALAVELAEEAAAAELAAEAAATQLAAGTVAAELAEEADRALDPDFDPDVLTVAGATGVEPGFLVEPGLTEAEAGGADVAEVDLGGPAGDLADVVPIGVAAGDERPAGSGTEPGADLPAAGAALAADAAATGAALAADAAVAAPAEDGTVPPGDHDGLDGYLAVDPPLPGYDELSIPQLRGRLRALSLAQVEAMAGYERSHQARPAYLTMLENRITTLRSR